MEIHLLPVGGCREASPPQLRRSPLRYPVLELHWGGSVYATGHVICAPVYLLPGSPLSWVGVLPPGTAAVRACLLLAMNVLDTFP